MGGLISLETPSLETKSHDIQFPVVHPDSSIATCSCSVLSGGYYRWANQSSSIGSVKAMAIEHVALQYVSEQSQFGLLGRSLPMACLQSASFHTP